MGAAVTIPFKKNKLVKGVPFRSGMNICDCNDESVRDQGFCTINIDSENGRKEFFTIQLVGGGAAGSGTKGGEAGESKTVYYPMLNGTYRVYVGLGGVYGNDNDPTASRNGGHTVLYKVNDGGETLQLIDFAAGGMGSVEKNPYSAGTSDYNELKIGELPGFSVKAYEDGETICGKGGDAGQNGSAGGAVIKW